ncbi:MAG: trigger factor [Anaerolineales bacterium]|nr:MAG: trigger factor [Anaerolineales bacterium]
MKVETAHLEDHQVKLTVEIETSALESAKRKAARKIARQIKIPGFRPGKAPYPIVLRQVGEASVLEEAIEILIQDIYPEIIKTAEIEPFGPGTLENILSTEPPKFEFVVPLKATVELSDYKRVRESYEPEGIKDEDVEDVIDNLLEQHAISEPVDRNSQTGDLVHIQINVSKVGEEDDSNPLIKERPINILITDKDEEDEWPFPGFAKHLLDLKVGDRKQIKYRYDDDTQYDNFRNVDAIFDVEVMGVSSRTLPQRDDEFAQSVGAFSSIDELRKTIRENLENQALTSYNAEYDERILEKIVDESSISYPPQMLEKEIDAIIHNLNERLEQQGLSMDLYLKSRQLEMESLRDETRSVAETRLKKSLVLLEAADLENIQIDPQELQVETEKTLGEASRVLPEREYRKLVKGEVASNLVGNIMMEMLIEKTRQRLREISRGEASETETPENDEMESEQELIDDTGEQEQKETPMLESNDADILENPTEIE